MGKSSLWAVKNALAFFEGAADKHTPFFSLLTELTLLMLGAFLCSRSYKMYIEL
jgi:hypothetical protein